jgi:hypothetical protein
VTGLVQSSGSCQLAASTAEVTVCDDRAGGAGGNARLERAGGLRLRAAEVACVYRDWLAAQLGVVLQKTRVHSLTKGFRKRDVGPFRHRIIGTVKRRFERFGESAHFELYR